MASILASRLLGFFRDWTVVHQISLKASTDAYFAAFTLPDFLNYLVAGGALTVTFIPVFTKYATEGREEEGWEVFSTILTFMGLVLVALVVVAEVFAPRLGAATEPDFRGAKLALLVHLVRLMLPAQICFFLGGVLAAVQYARGKFLIPSLAPIIYNLAIILGGVLLSARFGVAGFSVGVVAGALVGNLLLQIYGAWRVGARYRPRLHLRHPGFILFLKLTVPIMLALSLPYTDDWIWRYLASFLGDGPITWLTLAKRLMQVPQGVVGQAVGVAAFPVLAQLYSEKRYDELNRLLHHTLKAMLLLLVPIAALTAAQSVPLAYLVYRHTRMTNFDLLATGQALLFFALGLGAWGAQGILARGFYATRDTLTPAIAGTTLTFLALPLYWTLERHMQHRGLALASTIAITVYAVTLFVFLVRRTHSRQTADLLWFLLKIGAAAAVAGVACYEMSERLGRWLSWRSTGGAFVDLVLATAFGVLVLVALCWLLRLRELEEYLRELWQMVRSRLDRVAASTPQP